MLLNKYQKTCQAVGDSGLGSCSLVKWHLSISFVKWQCHYILGILRLGSGLRGFQAQRNPQNTYINISKKYNASLYSLCRRKNYYYTKRHQKLSQRKGKTEGRLLFFCQSRKGAPSLGTTISTNSQRLETLLVQLNAEETHYKGRGDGG